ncbi:ribonuclease P protein component [Vagococcus humatus]|uniref:Ribonuclease P protein component n=1 Tax=Vagococcus humatus TaxID=1889241 RepID=A0A429Z4I6_9ENTE|nr:ribonuclease P protein component [Vagococcus humatus]RST88597.1 ribonuclease P protein component [Vagococcus humatus]
MKKSYRIKKEKEFKQIIQKRQSFANRHLIVYVRLNEESDHFRVGLSVGKKIGNAVTRNRVKRQIRQSVFELQEDIVLPYDLVIIARPNIVQLSTLEVKENLRHVLQIANVIGKRGKESEEKTVDV